jgi:inhibitor of the pro-sigma K processing machinery
LHLVIIDGGIKMLLGGAELGNIPFDVKPIILFVVLLFGLYGWGRYLEIPWKIIKRVVLNSLLGLVLIIVINFLGKITNFQIPLNFLTVPIVGFLGVPGVVLLAVLKYIL